MTGQSDSRLSFPTSKAVAMTHPPTAEPNRNSLPILLWIVPVVVLVVAVFPLPYGYYTFVRIVTCIACVTLAYAAYGPDHRSQIWTSLFIVIAIVFNPVIPVYLKKQVWMFIDGIAAAVILGHLLTVRGLRS